MSAFPYVERCRGELRALRFERLGSEQLDGMRERLAHAHHSSAIEDVHPTPELAALYAMFVEERAPPEVYGPFVDRWLRERLATPRLQEAV